MGRFPDDLTDHEIAHFFSLAEEERRTVDRRRRPLNRLGVALQIGFFRLTGTPLNSVEMIPPRVLADLDVELGIAPPRLASIRALYRRRRTLFEHQEAAKRTFGVQDLTEHGERALNGLLRREAGDKFLVDDSEQGGRAWLGDHYYIQLPSRRLRGSASAARRHHDAGLLAGVIAAVGDQTADTIEAGVRGEKGALSFDITAYYSWLNGEIVSTTDPVTQTVASVGNAVVVAV